MPDAERRCQRIYGKSLAQFEYQRNSDLYAVDSLRPYCAKPLSCLKTNNGEFVFVQEYINGQSLRDHITELGYLSKGLFEMGEFIVKEAERHNMHDLDLHPSNLKAVLDGNSPRPVLFDFNLIPQHDAPSNPFLYLFYKLGIRKPSYRDYRSVRRWLDMAPLK